MHHFAVDTNRLSDNRSICYALSYKRVVFLKLPTLPCAWRRGTGYQIPEESWQIGKERLKCSPLAAPLHCALSQFQTKSDFHKQAHILQEGLWMFCQKMFQGIHMYILELLRSARRLPLVRVDHLASLLEQSSHSSSFPIRDHMARLHGFEIQAILKLGLDDVAKRLGQWARHDVERLVSCQNISTFPHFYRDGQPPFNTACALVCTILSYPLGVWYVVQ